MARCGKGYDISMPKQWVVDYGPAILAGLQCLAVASAAGRIIGLPLPNLSGATESAILQESSAIVSFAKTLSKATGQAAAGIAEAGAGAAAEVIANIETDTEEAIAQALDLMSIDAVAQPSAACGAAYRALRALVAKQDPNLLECGLEKVICEQDGSVEWVQPGNAAARFRAEGRSALHWSRGLQP